MVPCFLTTFVAREKFALAGALATVNDSLCTSSKRDDPVPVGAHTRTMNPFGNDSYRNNDAGGSNPFGQDDDRGGGQYSRQSDVDADPQSPTYLRPRDGSFDSSPGGGPMPVAKLDFGGSPQPQPYTGGSSTPDRDGVAPFKQNRVLARSASLARGDMMVAQSTSVDDSDNPGDTTSASADVLLATDQQLLQELGLTWQDNDAATNCWCCDRGFSLVRRKHHCRMCGYVVCWDCSSQKMVVPGFDTKQRVCSKCSSTWIEKLVTARRAEQQLKLELEASEIKVGELSFQKSRLQAKSAELLATVDELRSEVAQQRSVTEELHQQLEDKTMQIMKLKKQVAAAAAASSQASSSKKDKSSPKRGKRGSTGGVGGGGGGGADGKLDPAWQPPSSGDLMGEIGSEMLGGNDDADGEGGREGHGAPAKVDESCKCVIS